MPPTFPSLYGGHSWAEVGSLDQSNKGVILGEREAPKWLRGARLVCIRP